MISFAPKIANIQPAFVQGTKDNIIKIEGLNLKAEQQYGLKILNGYNNTELGMLYAESDETDLNILTFNNSLSLNAGNYYRFQIVETIENEIAGPWSNIAVAKCILQPITSLSYIPELSRFKLEFTNNPQDRLKKAAIKLIDNNLNTIWIGSEAIAEYDTQNIYWDFNRIIIADNTPTNLKVQVEYVTENGFSTVETKNADSVTSLIITNGIVGTATLTTSVNDTLYEQECGCALLNTKNKVYRQELAKDNWVMGIELFANSDSENKTYKFADTSIKYNTETIYIVPQNDKWVRIIKQICFDHCYLSDNIENYCIKFNPKISSLRTIIKEEKIETIGGKYPFILQNGAMAYKEFSLSGLISCLWQYTPMEEVQRVSPIPPASQYETFNKFAINTNTDLTEHNIKDEFEYREKLLSWLNNGKPKLFKSPTEGNLIVQITGVSLTPNETLGRMLYTFSCTVTEIANYTLDNLKAYNLLQEG